MEYLKYLTDPNNHDPENFVYITRGIMADEIIPELPAMTKYEMYNWSQAIIESLNGNPEQLNRLSTKFYEFGKLEKNNFVNVNGLKIGDVVKKVKSPLNYLSASFIGKLNSRTAKALFGLNDKLVRVSTYSTYGIIIRPGSDDLVKIAWNSDCASPIENRDEMFEFVKKNADKKLPASELLSTSYSTDYNELVIWGSQSNKIAGIFYSKPNAKEKAKDLAEKLQPHLRTEIPVVELIRGNDNNYKVPEHLGFIATAYAFGLSDLEKHSEHASSLPYDSEKVAEKMMRYLEAHGGADDWQIYDQLKKSDKEYRHESEVYFDFKNQSQACKLLSDRELKERSERRLEAALTLYQQGYNTKHRLEEQLNYIQEREERELWNKPQAFYGFVDFPFREKFE